MGSIPIGRSRWCGVKFSYPAQMNKNKYLIITVVVLILLAGGLLGYKYFYGSSSKKIEIKNEVAENNNLAETANEENPEVTLEEIKNNSPEIKTNNQDKTETAADKNLQNDKINITNKFVSWGFEKSDGRKIDTIIIHSTYNALGGDPFSLDKILDIYKSYGVSPHYIIDRNGKIYRLVADENIAYHAGESQVPDGRAGVNNFSIGIEIINSKTDKFTSEQYDSLNYLLRYLRNKYSIKDILGHNQIAPGRKDDPWNIIWSKVDK